MIELSSMVTGSELTAKQWDNHSKELENTVTFAGLSLSENENDLARAIDIFSKSNIYDTTNDDNDYTIINRGLSVEELKGGMIVFVRFNKANTDKVRLDFGKGFINVKNADESDLTNMRFKDGTILPLLYNGSDFISTIYLFKYINDDINGYFNSVIDDDSVISPYIEWNDDYLENQTYKLFIVRGNIVKDFLTLEILLFTEGDLKDNDSANASDIKIDINKFFTEQYDYDVKISNYQTGTGVIVAEDTSIPYTYPTCPILFDIWKDGSSHSNKIVTNLGRRGWVWDNDTTTQYDKLRFYFQVNVKIEVI